MQTIKLIVRIIAYVRVCSTTLDILTFGDKTSIVYYLNILGTILLKNPFYINNYLLELLLAFYFQKLYLYQSIEV